jgi:pimeloyl-ACP methyl ester carboxylesterase
MSRHEQFAAAADGRTLCFAEWGDPDGFPVFTLHGTPGGRLNRHLDESKYAEAGARIITYDRPGYGGSDRDPGRVVVDCVADVAAIADVLAIETFSVVGGSGGGPHALAVAARLPDRVVRARCDVGCAPYPSQGLDWLAGMDPKNVAEFGRALEGEESLLSYVVEVLAEMAANVAEDPSKILDGFELSEADRAVLQRTELAQVIREATEDLARGGPWGWVDDDLVFVKPWGFDISEIRVPVEVRYGLTDVLVPAAHGAWLAAHVPNATVVTEAGKGHLSDLDKVVESTRWLVTGTY